MKKIINGRDITLGTCYYPEHWEKEIWEEDLKRMLDVGIQVVRIAEFAWNKIEPKEGEYTYQFFDEFLDLAEKIGMKVIFATPTATPPAWLTKKYPEVLNRDMDGNPYYHGSRRHYNYNSPVYHEFCKRITEKSAAHYAGRACIIGWQIDNELNCEKDVFYSESDTLAFREFLKDKYATLDALNKAWGTLFWNQTYTAWEEIYVPRKTVSNGNNPHQVLDYTRFISDSACRFAKMQGEIIRKYCKEDDFVTTNGLFSNLDNHRMAEESLDFFTYDSYPNFAYCLADYRENDLMKDRKWSRSLSEVRSISKTFGIMEQQSGANGWNTRMEAPTPKPGQLTLWTMQSIAHGADFVSYFRWRTCTMGTEIYWHGILDYSGRENRRLAEVREVYKKLKSLQELAGAKYQAKVAILKDYDNIWDAQLDVWHERVERASQKGLFEAMQITHTPFDYLYLRDNTTLSELQKYNTLFYPHGVIMTKERTALLERYVEEGGTLIMGCRTGYKDTTGQCVSTYLPGLVSKLMGTDIPEYSFVAPDDGMVFADWDGTAVEAAVFNDLLAPVGTDAKVLATYSSSYYKGTPALIEHSFGKGKAYYFGGAFATDTAKVFLEKLGIAGTFESEITLPSACELAVRETDDARYLFVLNYQRETVDIELKTEMLDVFGKTVQSGRVSLEGYGVGVYKISKNRR